MGRIIVASQAVRRTGFSEVEAARRLKARGRTPRPRASSRRPSGDACWRFAARRRCREPTPSRNSQTTCGGLVVLAERLRDNAHETVAFFAEQGVELKVLSGDAPPEQVPGGVRSTSWN